MTGLPAPGAHLAGRYRLKDQLEQHALGGLFTATYEPFESKVFMELIRPETTRPSGGGGDPRSRGRLAAASSGEDLRECLQRAARMRGPNLCGLIEWFEENGFICVASEYTAGITLRELLDEAGSLPLDQALEILGSCVEAAGAAYGCGIYYLALDPRNLLITPSGPVKLMRAGYFHVLEASDPILVHESMLYRSPEAVRGVPSRPADVYALAVMLREMLGPSRPARLEAILSQATAGEPAGRPSARPFLEALVEEVSCVKRAIHQGPFETSALPGTGTGFPKPEPRSRPPEPDNTVRRYLIALAILLAAAYLMARFIGGCQPVKPGSPGPIPQARICAFTSPEPLPAALPALSTRANRVGYGV